MKNSLGIDPEVEEGDAYFNMLTCDDAANLWEELALFQCPFCGAKEDADGVVIHMDNGIH